MSDKVLRVFTNRHGVPHRLVELSTLTKVASGYRYAIDRFNGNAFEQITTCHFQDIQSAEKQFTLRENVDGIIEKRDRYFSSDDRLFTRSLEGSKYAIIYSLLNKLKIIDIEFVNDLVIYSVDMNNISTIPEIKQLNINPSTLNKVRIQEDDLGFYFGFEFKDGKGIGVLHTMDLPDSEKHRVHFNFKLNFDPHLC